MIRWFSVLGLTPAFVSCLRISTARWLWTQRKGNQYRRNISNQDYYLLFIRENDRRKVVVVPRYFYCIVWSSSEVYPVVKVKI